MLRGRVGGGGCQHLFWLHTSSRPTLSHGTFLIFPWAMFAPLSFTRIHRRSHTRTIAANIQTDTHTHRVKEARPYIRKVWKTENEERKNVQIEYRAGRGEGKDRREPRQQTRRPRTMHRSMTVTRRTLTTEKAVADADVGLPVMAVS